MLQSEVVWSRGWSASGAPPAPDTCARCGATGPLQLEAAALRGIPALGPFARFCSSQCFRANWHQLRDLQPWASSVSAERRAQASVGGGEGCSASTDCNTATEVLRVPSDASNTQQRVVLGRGERYIPTIADIGKATLPPADDRLTICCFAPIPRRSRTAMHCRLKNV